MEQINKVELKGNVGTVRISKVGDTRVARFSLATNYIYRNRDGETTIETSWHNIVAWEGRNVQDLDKIEKGSPVHVFGRLKSSKYTSAEGEEKQIYEVIANRFSLVSEVAEIQ